MKRSVSKSIESFGKKESECSLVQERLFDWQNENFDDCSISDMALGISEECGELAHAILKHKQGIRGMGLESDMIDAVGDAIADIAIFSMQLCSMLQIDFYELVFSQHGVSEEILNRVWKKRVSKNNE